MTPEQKQESLDLIAKSRQAAIDGMIDALRNTFTGLGVSFHQNQMKIPDNDFTARAHHRQRLTETQAAAINEHFQQMQNVLDLFAQVKVEDKPPESLETGESEVIITQ